MDMLVNLYQIPEFHQPSSAHISRMLAPDQKKVLRMVQETFGDGWAGECIPALSSQPSTCFVAQKEGRIIGFACYDATARGYFGPIGLIPEERRGGIGEALLLAALHAMREAGYGYAVIGWCDEAAGFYARCCHAVEIPDSEPSKTVYSRLTRWTEHDE